MTSAAFGASVGLGASVGAAGASVAFGASVGLGASVGAAALGASVAAAGATGAAVGAAPPQATNTIDTAANRLNSLKLFMESLPSSLNNRNKTRLQQTQHRAYHMLCAN